MENINKQFFGKRAMVFIDGGNFYHLVLKKFKIDETKFDFEKFVQFLTENYITEEFSKRFYVGTIVEDRDNPKSIQSMKNQNALFTFLRVNKWYIGTSKLKFRKEKIVIDGRVDNFEKIKRSGINEIWYKRYREKGIDTKIVADLIIGAFEDKYDLAIVVSSDTDILPAIECARNINNKKVSYVGFDLDGDGLGVNKSIFFNVDSRVILNREELSKFIVEAS
jgi:uncharacterized LabA/DUF88 family protein